MKTKKIMRKLLFLVLLCFISKIQFFVPVLIAKEKDEWDQAEEYIVKSIPQLPTLSNNNSNDLEIQLGIVGLYFQYGSPQTDKQQSSEEYVHEQNQMFLAQCNKVFLIDPNNKPALAIFSKRICSEFCAVRNSNMDQLDRLITNARKRNSEVIEIFPGTSLRKYFSEEDDCVIEKRPYGSPPAYALLINDFDAAIKQLGNKLDNDFPKVLSRIIEAQNKDTENAYYNYLKAALFFEIGDKEKAVKEIEDGVSNKYFSSFQEELAIAMNKVLQEAGMPQKLLDFLLDVRNPFEDFVIKKIWNGGLSDIGKEYEINENEKNAEYIYELTIKMAKQIQKEAIHVTLNLDKAAMARINELSSIEISKQEEKIVEQNISSTKKLLRVALPITGAAVAVIVIASLIIFSRRKKTQQS